MKLCSSPYSEVIIHTYLVNNIDPYVNNGLCQISIENYKKIENDAINLTSYKETLKSIIKHGGLRIVEK